MNKWLVQGDPGYVFSVGVVPFPLPIQVCISRPVLLSSMTSIFVICIVVVVVLLGSLWKVHAFCRGWVLVDIAL